MVRFNGNWLTKEQYAAARADADAELAKRSKEDEARAEATRKRRAEEEAFAKSQREKGLELYNSQWLPKEEVRGLVQRNKEVAEATREVDSKSVMSAIFSIFQVANDGMLIEIRSGEIKNRGVNTDIAFLFGAAGGMSADGDFYKGELYWCGSYSYLNISNIRRTVNAYCLDKNQAISRVRQLLGGGTDSADNPANEDRRTTKSAAGSDVPEPLREASATGSGFFVGDEGHFVTCAHVIEKANSISVYYEGQHLRAVKIAVSKVTDLAILKVDRQVKGILIVETERTPGQDVFAIGFPHPGIQGLEVKVTKGVISSRKGLEDDETKYQIDAAVQPGNSGGPLCDPAGNLVGVVVARLNEIAVASKTGSIPQNVNYAIKASEVAALLRTKSIALKVDAGSRPSTNDAISGASKATALVIVK